MIRTSAGSVIAALLFIGSAFAAEPEGLRFMGLDTHGNLEANLDAMNDVKETTSERFEQVWTGMIPPDSIGVMMGLNAGRIELLTASKRGSFGREDRADIAAMERVFGLEGRERHVGECGAADSSPGSCVAVFYECPDAPPLCHITVFSWGTDGDNNKGITRVSWEASAVDLTKPQP